MHNLFLLLPLLFLLLGATGVVLAFTTEYMPDSVAQEYVDNNELPPHLSESQRQFNLFFGVGFIVAGAVLLGFWVWVELLKVKGLG